MIRRTPPSFQSFAHLVHRDVVPGKTVVTTGFVLLHPHSHAFKKRFGAVIRNDFIEDCRFDGEKEVGICGGGDGGGAGGGAGSGAGGGAGGGAGFDDDDGEHDKKEEKSDDGGCIKHHLRMNQPFHQLTECPL